MLLSLEARRSAIERRETSANFADLQIAEQRRLLHSLLSVGHPLSVLTIYGDPDAILAGIKVRDALEAAIGVASNQLVKEPPYPALDAALAKVADARQQFVLATRKDLGIKPTI
jgi:hypothetical protein